jgi:hypothetical protein
MITQDAVFELPLRIICAQPRWIYPFILVAISGAVICLIVAELAWTSRSLLAAVLAVLVVKATGQTRSRCSGLILDANDRWCVLRGDNKAFAATLYKATVVFGASVVLVLKSEDNQYYNFILTETNVDRAQLRRLRVRLAYPKSGVA